MQISYRKNLEEKKIRLKLLENSKKRYIDELDSLVEELGILHKTRDIFQKASVLTQNHLAKHLSSIVTKSLRMIWHNSNISFHVEFVERRNVTECDMWIEEDGHQYSLLDGKGYGIVDVVSFSLKVAYILLHNNDNVCIIDEPARNLSKNKHEVFSMVVKELARELEMQFLIATHSKAIITHADASFYIENGEVKNI